MTNKQKTMRERFCREWILDHNGTRAALAAGFGRRKDGSENPASAATVASRLLSTVEVAARVRELEANVAEALGITAASVLGSLVDTRERAKTAVPVMQYDPLTKQNVETGEYKFDGITAAKCDELLGKHLGLWVDNVKVTVTPRIIDDV